MLTKMPGRKEFCDILAEACIDNLPGSWAGHSRGSHPRGVIRGNIKLINEWNVNNYCSIEITDGDGWSKDYCTNPAASGNAHPRAIEGKSIVDWNNGDWQGEQFKDMLENIILMILNQAIEHSIRVSNWNRAIREQERIIYETEKKRLENAAFAKVTQLIV